MTVAPYNVLVVDDEFASLEVLALLLRAEGFGILMASNGEEALKRLAEAEISLVVTDYKMPKMNGVELCERMLATPGFRNIPVIFSSATYRQDVPLPPNVVAFFSKPLSFKELLARVHGLLPARAFDDAEQAVVILLLDGIELVIVATGAGDRQAEECFGHDIDLVIDAIGLILANIDRCVDLLTEPPEPGADDGFVELAFRI